MQTSERMFGTRDRERHPSLSPQHCSRSCALPGRAGSRSLTTSRRRAALSSCSSMDRQRIRPASSTSCRSHRDLSAQIGELDAWRREGITVLTVLDADYPENLRTVYDRPPLVFVAAELRPEDSRSLAVVGTRRPTDDGIARARRIARHLAASDYTVASGLAAGIDTTAHTAALDAGGRTVAVIGTGLRRAYPKANAALQARIAGKGAVISQFLPDAPPTKRSFPMRNGVMLGLALATVVVEAGEVSGSRMQA